VDTWPCSSLSATSSTQLTSFLPQAKTRACQSRSRLRLVSKTKPRLMLRKLPRETRILREGCRPRSCPLTPPLYNAVDDNALGEQSRSTESPQPRLNARAPVTNPYNKVGKPREQMPGKRATSTTACPLAHTFDSPACDESHDAWQQQVSCLLASGSEGRIWRSPRADATATPTVLASRSMVGLSSRLSFHWVVRGVDSRRNVHGNPRPGGRGCA